MFRSSIFCAKTFMVVVFVLFALVPRAQVYILNEDFSSATGTTPPAGWSNLTVTGTHNI